MKSLRIPAALAILLALGACASMPNGPSVMVLPGDGKSFDQFRFDDNECRGFAAAQVSGSVNAANDSAAKGAVIGTLLGAAAGAAIGGDHRGAGVGAGAGLLMGSAAGSAPSSQGLQRRYDNGYLQCMYAKGHKVPQVSTTSRRTASYVATAPTPVPAQPAPATGAAIPPPPAGMPPPPPPGVSSPR